MEQFKTDIAVIGAAFSVKQMSMSLALLHLQFEHFS